MLQPNHKDNMADANAVNDPNPDNLEDNHKSVLLEETPVPVVTPAPAAVVPVAASEAPVEYEPTGDVGMDMALAFVGKAGIAIDHPAMKAAEQGDFTILRAVLAQKGVAGYEQFVALGEAAYQRTVAANATKAKAVETQVHQLAGGPEEWNAVRTWAGANATPEEKAEINALLNKGGLATKGVVRYLVDAYNRANNVEVTPKDPTVNAGRGGEPTGANAPLGPRAYQEAVNALNNKLNGRLEGSKEYANLQARRAAYRG